MRNTFVTFGSPLIDIIINVDQSFLDKFDLKPNDAVAVDEKSKIFDEIQEHSPKYVVGGCALNTARILKKVLKDTSCTVVGAVGDDNYSKLVKKQLDQDDVNYVFVTVPKTTGRCAVLINGPSRSLCTDLGASRFFTSNHLHTKEVWDCVKRAKCVYIPAFFLSVSVDSVFAIAKQVKGKIFALNLGAPFIAERFSKEICQLLPFVDLLFGNESEARALAHALGIQSSNLKQILRFLNEKSKSMTLVITRGAKSVYLVKNNKVTTHYVKKLKEKSVIDTSAAGDAFVGGFLGSFIIGKSLIECVSDSINVAQTVIKSSGCFYSENKSN